MAEVKANKSESERIRELEEAVGGEPSFAFMEMECGHVRGVVHYLGHNGDGENGITHLNKFSDFEQPYFCQVCFCSEILNDDDYKRCF